MIDDVATEYDRIERILEHLDEGAWLTQSGALGWTVADVVLHLAQSEEAVVASTSGRSLLEGRTIVGDSVDEIMDNWVRAEGAAPDVIFTRWQTAKNASVKALREADPQQPLPWVAAPLKPKAMATTRLAEHWAHALDIVGPLGIDTRTRTGCTTSRGWLTARCPTASPSPVRSPPTSTSSWLPLMA